VPLGLGVGDQSLWGIDGIALGGVVHRPRPLLSRVLVILQDGALRHCRLTVIVGAADELSCRWRLHIIIGHVGRELLLLIGV